MGPAAWLLSAALVLQSPPASGAAPPEDRWPDSRPITHLFQNLFRDIRNLPSTTTLKTLVVGSVGGGLARTRDRWTADWAERAGARSYTRSGDLIGVAGVQAGTAFGTYLVGKIAHQPAITHIGGDLIRAQALTAIMTQSLKYGIDRARPNGGSHSFPSGHTSATFATATVLSQHFGWKTAVPAYATAGFVAWTRVRDRKHYPSDVVIGATLGLIGGQTVTKGHRSWTIAPVKTDGGFAVYVVR